MGANRSTEQISVYSFVFPVALESKAENKETGRCNTKHTVTMISVISKNIGRNREKIFQCCTDLLCCMWKHCFIKQNKVDGFTDL